MQETKKPKLKCGICCIPVTSRGVLDCCTDIFCFSCIDTWSAFTNLCPLCKLQFKFITCAPIAEEKEETLVTPSVGEGSAVELDKGTLCDVKSNGAFVDFLGQGSKERSWYDGTSEDVAPSFPSFYIEEDAVVCLDGDGCTVRTRSQSESGYDGTSVACDACDCWYHAVCVGYKPDSENEQTWICPRCTGTSALDLFRFQPSTIKNYAPKPLINSLTLDNNLPITFVDEGEIPTAVSTDSLISESQSKKNEEAEAMDLHTFIHETNPKSVGTMDSSTPKAGETMDSSNPKAGEAMDSSKPKAGETMDPGGTDADIIAKTLAVGKEGIEGNFETYDPTSFASVTKELNEAGFMEVEETLSIKQELEQELEGGGTVSGCLNEVCEVSQSIVDKNDSLNVAETNDPSSDMVEANDSCSDMVETNKLSKIVVETNVPSKNIDEANKPKNGVEIDDPSKSMVETNQLSKNVIETDNPSKNIVETNQPSKSIVEETDVHDEEPFVDVKPSGRKRRASENVSKEYHGDKNQLSKNVVETGNPSKNIVETNQPTKSIVEETDVHDEEPFVDVKPSGRKRRASENVSKECHGDKKKLKTEDRSGEGTIQDHQSSKIMQDIPQCIDDKDQNDRSRLEDRQFPLDNRTLNKDAQKKVSKKHSMKEVVSNAKIEETCSSPASSQEEINPKMDAADELKELVQGMNPCNRRLILNGGEENDTMTQTRKIVYRGNDLDDSVSKILDEMRKQLLKTANPESDSRKVDVTDDKFFAAFKAAVISQSSLEVPSKKTVLGPCPTRDVSRQNLMKKLCGGSTKYDRDWDISFWKGKVANQRQAKETTKDLLQKEIAQIEESKRDPDNAELLSLKSRVFLADTSLLPRHNDIKPLSQLSEQKSPARAQQAKAAGLKKTASATQKDTEVAPPETKPEPTSDKRQWALNILARKKKTEEKPQGKKGSLLEGLPQRLRPVLEYDRRSKVPTASRQVQLDRFIEFYLRRAQLDSLDDSPQLRDAIQEAVDKEKEIYDRSNSKGVYNNLCVQALAASSKVVSKPPEISLPKVKVSYEDPVVLAALKAAGLVSDSPPESPCRGQEDPLTHPSETANQEIKSNSSVDIIEETPAITAVKSPKAGSGQIKEDSIPTQHMTATQRNNDTDVNISDVNTMSDGNGEKITSSQDMEKFNECVQPEWSNETLQQMEVDSQLEDSVRENLALMVDNSSHNDISSQLDSASLQDKTSNDEDLHAADKISKQVERFVKEHIRPLHKSHVISTEQYNWAVSKTTKKVMQHHKHSKMRISSYLKVRK